MKRRLTLLLAISLTVLVTDQLTKFWAVDRLTKLFETEGLTTLPAQVRGFLTADHLEGLRERPVVVSRDYWQFKYVENPGAAWGLLGKVPEHIRVPFFHVVSVVAISFILLFFRRLDERQRLLQVALSLVLGGALGNFLDRLVRGYVIDFVDWHWRNDPGIHWPTFNIADVGISVGVALMLGDTLLVKRQRVASSEPEPVAPQPPAPVLPPADDLSTALTRASEEAGNPPGVSGGSESRG